MTTFFIYLLIFACIGLGVFNYLNIQKLNTQQLKLRVLAKQNKDLTAQVNTLNRPVDNLKIFYHPLNYLHGEITNRTSLYLSPIYNSPVLRIVHSGVKLEILDLCESFDTLWYEVKIICDETVNLKGFIKKEFVKELETVETGLMYKN
ncbi:hypothetical protein [Clostridium sp. UBA4548]|uniref:hypothetical protein n=1 Tax=Clostridium sp. UBA4548 TaxID=1946361 RepID=UPI0025BCDD5E|nr:hypothetical protein [Clostridium sp. UBA4548]